jgi:NAD(P)-dependent dehydrogenase (short-subunit alcohol dehydrogenase family)
VSVLCPGGVRTEIVRSGRNRPAELGDAPPPPRQIEEAIDRAIDPAVVADLVLDGIRSDELYILTETGTRAAVEARFAGLLAAYDRLAARQQ